VGLQAGVKSGKTVKADVAEALERLNREMTWAAKPSDDTLYRYQRLGLNFLNSLDHFPPTTDDVKNWILPLPSQSYKRWVYYILKKLFLANHWEWDIKKPPEKGEVLPPTLDYDTISYLILARELLDPRQRAYLALSTVYGFRRAELASLSKNNFNHQLVVATVKRGRVRVHSIPDEIRDVVLGYEFHRIDPSWLSRIFQRILRDAGLDPMPGYGFHSIRSSLITQLILAGVNPVVISKWMGWKTLPSEMTQLGVSRMLEVYGRPEVEEADEIIFSFHPWLKLWGK